MPSVFTRYQKFVVAVLAFLQFTIILDFMIISPLGALLLRDLNITTRQFGLVVSAYAFSAGASGLLAAGFADKFDRKRLLLFFYAGFMLGTLLCGVFAVAALSDAPGTPGTAGLLEGNSGQVLIQLYGIAATLVWSGGVTYVLLKLVSAFVPLRVSLQQELEGLDISQHGEALQ